MNSKSADLNGVRRKLFHKDEYRAFKMALDVEETDLEDFCINISKQESNKFDRLSKSAFKNRNVLKDRNTDCVEEKREYIKAKALGYSLKSVEDSKENLHPEPEEKESTGAKKKIVNKKKEKTSFNPEASVTDASNTHSGLDDVKKNVKRSSDTSVLKKKKSLLTSEEAKEISTGEASKLKKVRESRKRKESKLCIGEKNSQEKCKEQINKEKPKSYFKVQLRERKNPKQKKNLIEAKITKSYVSINDLPNLEKSANGRKTKIDESVQNEVIGKKIHLTRAKKQQDSVGNATNPTEKDRMGTEEKKADNKKPKATEKTGINVKSTRSRKSVTGDPEKVTTMVDVTEGDDEKEGKNSERKSAAKSRVRKPKIVKGFNQECATEVKESKKKRGKSIIETKMPDKEKDQVRGECSSKFDDDKQVDTMNDNTIINFNISTKETAEFEATLITCQPIENNGLYDNQLEQNNKSDENKLKMTSGVNTNVVLDKTDQSILIQYHKSCIDLNNTLTRFDFKNKNDDKSTLVQVIENPGLSEKEMKIKIVEKTVEDLEKCPTLDEQDQIEKTLKKTSYGDKQEALSKRREIRLQKKMIKAVSKFSNYTQKHFKKVDLSSHPSLKKYIGWKSDSESTSDCDEETSTEECYCSECSCLSACSCSCCTDSDSSYDSENSSSSNDGECSSSSYHRGNDSISSSGSSCYPVDSADEEAKVKNL